MVLSGSQLCFNQGDSYDLVETHGSVLGLYVLNLHGVFMGQLRSNRLRELVVTFEKTFPIQR